MNRIVKMKALKGLFTFEKFLGNRHADIFIYSQTMRRLFMKIVAEVLQMLQKLQTKSASGEMVDALALGASGATHPSSSLGKRTIPCKTRKKFSFYNFQKTSISDFNIGRIADMDSKCLVRCI